MTDLMTDRRAARIEPGAHRAAQHRRPGLPPRRGSAASGSHCRTGHPGVGRGVADRISHHRRRRRHRAGRAHPTGTALLDDVTLSNAGLREDATVLVAPVTVYGARSVTLSGSALATQSVSSATLRQALLGKVLTVGDTVSLLPRDLGPGTSTSEASSALAASVGITWTSELLTVTGTDPAGPVSRAAEFVGHLGRRQRRRPRRRARRRRSARPPQWPEDPPVSIDDLKGQHVQAGRLTEWLKLALDEPALLEKLGAKPNLGVLITGPAGVGKARLVRAVCARPTAGGSRRPGHRRAGRERPPAGRGPRGRRCVQRRRRAAGHRYRRAAARPAGTGVHDDPQRTQEGGRRTRGGAGRHLAGSRTRSIPGCARRICATANWA